MRPEVGQLRMWRPAWRTPYDEDGIIFLIIEIEEETYSTQILSGDKTMWVTLSGVARGSELIDETG